jgi:glycosyltransferase involved in cell wall biosynthesis
MKITVIICTFNRCQLLRTALTSIAQSKLPAGLEWEILVVDNNSTDQTRQVVEEVARRYPARIRYCFEPRGGKAHAMNAGLREARGEILAFTDDDLFVEPTWLQDLSAAFDDPAIIGAGGRILPANNVALPPWLGMGGEFNMGGILCAHFDLGDQPRLLDQPPFGANMAFRRSAFEAYGPFRADLGPSPDTNVPRPNEDTEFGRRLLAAGERLLYVPTAVVFHPVPEHRIRKKYFLDWYFDYGRASILEMKPRPRIWVLPRHWFSIPKGIGRTMLATLPWMVEPNPQKRFYLKCRTWYLAGQVAELYRKSRSK